MGQGPVCCTEDGVGEAGGAHTPAAALQILAALPMDWRGTHLLACACLRVVFIPLFILCVYPSGAPALRHPAWPCVFSLLMGISNGYFGSVPMILAAGKVGPRQRELAGSVLCGGDRAMFPVRLGLTAQRRQTSNRERREKVRQRRGRGESGSRHQQNHFGGVHRGDGF